MGNRFLKLKHVSWTIYMISTPNRNDVFLQELNLTTLVNLNII